ncbi:prenyl cysteine carboxyl methyltransferase ste14 [Grosmannia clavigera kw1407]|uniref:Protein-S-isoprenylcysteine O-methyltransferase n=1 Tax=Grosmannia clavigera (strain kw1407 / UAMH 11150) TaxID=655863 RepID=F0XQ88_GROCL|nr:prenyl cysteine carboxyl methyltransferase ste14 [Grosmannia clavigera kw1407]EFX00079.1 prenyl cysteine carboxyl methyltransferase ste14 [Grosmannia clavigera kw1407]
MNGATAVDISAAVASQRRSSPNPITTSAAVSSHDAAAAMDLLGSPTTQYPPDRSLFPGQDRSLAGIAARAFMLGAVLAAGMLLTTLLALLPVLLSADTVALLAPLWRLPFFAAALAAFHFLEFYVTAAHNTPAASVDSFLLTANWPAYAIAHTAAFAECFVRLTVFRGSHLPGLAHLAPLWPARPLLLIGLVVVTIGQLVRSAAMTQAGRSFNHQIQRRRAHSHALVTTGIYAHLRHPSYFGFFWWALGTQLVLGNFVCFAAYAAVLWRFFSRRIRHEEQLLIRFFGDDYVSYQKRVGTKMPFI